MPPVINPDATARTERLVRAAPHRVFAAFAQADLLAQWWGPSGFTNTFQRFEFTPGGRWVFVMHGPNGVDYPNESVFREIEPERQVVIEHVVAPRFVLTVTLTARDDSTHVDWVQVFESADLAAKVRQVVEPANEQNLDRLESVLAGTNA